MWETDSEEEIANQYFFTKNFHRHLGRIVHSSTTGGNIPCWQEKLKYIPYFCISVLKF